MTKQNFAIQALKSIEATSRTRDSFKYNRVKTLVKAVRGLGFAFLLFDLSPVAAQVVEMVDNTTQTTQNRPKVVLRGITGETFTLKTGEVCEVWTHTDGRKYVVRANGRKYFPKRLNRDL